MASKSRPKRWAEAVAAAQTALDEMTGPMEKFQAACDDLRSLQEGYEGWKDNLPDNLQGSALGEKLEAVCDLSLEDVGSTLQEAIDAAKEPIDEAEGIDLPRGFGKD